MPALSAAERARAYRERQGAKGRKKDRQRKRHTRDAVALVRHVSNTGRTHPGVISIEGITTLAREWDERRQRFEKETGRSWSDDPIEADAYQEAYLKTLERAPRFKDPRQVASYVRRTAAGEAVELARTRDRDDSYDAVTERKAAEDDHDPEDDQRDNERRAVLIGAPASDTLGAAVYGHLTRETRIEVWISDGGLGDGSNVRRTGDGFTVRVVRGIREL